MAPPKQSETSSSTSRRPTVTARQTPRYSSLPTGPQTHSAQVEPGLPLSEPLVPALCPLPYNTYQQQGTQTAVPYNVNAYQQQGTQTAVLSRDGPFNSLGHNPYFSSIDGTAPASYPSTLLGKPPPPPDQQLERAQIPADKYTWVEQERGLEYQCGTPGCSRSFTYKGNLRNHERICRRAYRFICPECDKTFLRTDSLKVHSL